MTPNDHDWVCSDMLRFSDHSKRPSDALRYESGHSLRIFWARGPGLVDLAWSSRRNRTKTSKTITVLEGLIVIVVDYYRVRTCTNTMSIHKHDLDSCLCLTYLLNSFEVRLDRESLPNHRITNMHTLLESCGLTRRTILNLSQQTVDKIWQDHALLGGKLVF